MFDRTSYLLLLISYFCVAFYANALEPDQILIVANKDIKASVELAKYYCQKRGVPKKNIIELRLGSVLKDDISRRDYIKKIAEPLRDRLSDMEFMMQIRCLVTTYGVPMRVGERDPLPDHVVRSERIKKLIAKNERMLSDPVMIDDARKQRLTVEKRRLEAALDHITGKQSGASVDSELSMVLFGDYELYNWQHNRLKGSSGVWDFKTLMVSRLDGPSFDIARDLVDRATLGEKSGPRGRIYIDSRGIEYDLIPYSFGYYDQSLRQMAGLMKDKTGLEVIEEKTEALFGVNECPSTYFYCGWYSLEKYIDSFTFVNGAVAYHIASFEAVSLHDPNKSQWCSSLLSKGVTATLGAVAEPYLLAFPEPADFFGELLKGKCLVEAYYATKPFNSWQMVLIGDPLYTPVKNPDALKTFVQQKSTCAEDSGILKQ